MASFLCKCGNSLKNNLCPNNVQLRVYSDEEWFALYGIKIISVGDIPLPKKDVWRCPVCERIYVFDNEGNLSKTYILEKE